MLATRNVLDVKDVSIFFETISSDQSTLYLKRFREALLKFIRHIIYEHRLSPNKKISHLKTLMLDSWHVIVKDNIFANKLSNDKIILLENDLKNNCAELKSFLKNTNPEEEIDLESLIQALEDRVKTPAQRPLTIQIPAHIVTGASHYLKTSYPEITELNIGLRYLQEGYFESALTKFQQGIDKINQLEQMDTYHELAETLLTLKKHIAFTHHGWALNLAENKFPAESFKHAYAAVIALDNLSPEDLTEEDHGTLIEYVKFFQETLTIYSQTLETAHKFETAAKLYKTLIKEIRPVLNLNVIHIKKLLSQAYYNWGRNKEINPSENSGIDQFKLALAEHSQLDAVADNTSAHNFITATYRGALIIAYCTNSTKACLQGNGKAAMESYLLAFEEQEKMSSYDNVFFQKFLVDVNRHWITLCLNIYLLTAPTPEDVISVIDTYKTKIHDEKILWSLHKMFYKYLFTLAVKHYNEGNFTNSIIILNSIPIQQTPASLGLNENDVLYNPKFKFHQLILQVDLLQRLVVANDPLLLTKDDNFVIDIQRFFGKILLDQGYNIRSIPKLYNAKIRIFIHACDAFNSIPLVVKNSLDIANIRVCKLDIEYLSNQLKNKIESSIMDLLDKAKHKTYFFNENARKKFSEHKPQFNALMDLLKTVNEDLNINLGDINTVSDCLKIFVHHYPSNPYIKSINNIYLLFNSYFEVKSYLANLNVNDLSTLQPTITSMRP